MSFRQARQILILLLPIQIDPIQPEQRQSELKQTQKVPISNQILN